MSKSRGTQIEAATYLKHLDPAYLRYFYATKLNPKVQDCDLDLADFHKKVNADLVGKVVNLASRSARFVEQTGLSEVYPEDGGLFAKAAAAGESIAEAYEAFDFSRAARETMALADAANEYLEQTAPWHLKKDPEKASQVQDVCTVALNLYRQIVVYLAPVLPTLAEDSGALFGEDFTPMGRGPKAGGRDQNFEIQTPDETVDPKDIEKMVEESKVDAPGSDAPAAGDAPAENAGSGIDRHRTAGRRSVVSRDQIRRLRKG